MINRVLEWLGRPRAQINRAAELSAANVQRLDHLAAQLERLERETRLMLGYLSLPPNALWCDGPRPEHAEPAQSAFPYSTVCRQDCFEQPYFGYWMRRLGMSPSYHRKLWEHVFICQALWERGVIRPGARGLGFGVGREPLSALFAAEQCDVVATDLGAEAAVERGWSQTVQHATGPDALRFPHICPDEVFDRSVKFRVCDMNAAPDGLEGFDFCWSACALEHLGSLEAGLSFIERSVDCLKPGGWAVHTTEFNLSSDTHTVDHAATVLYRRRDMEVLAQRLAAKGHRLAPFDFEPGLMPLDRYIDVPPYRATPHLKLAIQGYAATSVGLLIQKVGADESA